MGRVVWSEVIYRCDNTLCKSAFNGNHFSMAEVQMPGKPRKADREIKRLGWIIKKRWYVFMSKVCRRKGRWIVDMRDAERNYEDLLSIAKELKGETLAIETSDYILYLLHNTATRAQQLEARVKELEEAADYLADSAEMYICENWKPSDDGYSCEECERSGSCATQSIINDLEGNEDAGQVYEHLSNSWAEYKAIRYSPK